MSMIFIIFALMVIKADLANKCRILGIEGGGIRTIYDIGAFSALADYMDPEEIKYDIMNGESPGAVAIGILGFFKNGDEKKAASFLTDIIVNLQLNQTFKSWPGGIPQGLLFEEGIFDDSPLLDTLKSYQKVAGGVLQRNCSLGVTYIDTVDFVVSLGKINSSNAALWSVKSSTVEGLFPPVHEDGHFIVDGGTQYLIELASAISFCSNLGYKDSDIIIDLLLNLMENMTAINVTNSSSMGMLSRAKYLISREKTSHYLYTILNSYPKVDWRYIAIPSKVLPVNYFNTFPIGFTRKNVNETLALGYQDMKNLIIGNTSHAALEKLKKQISHRFI